MRINLTTFLLISFFIQAGLGATAQKITVSERNISLPVLLDKISKLSGYDFFYTNEMLEHKSVTVNFKNAELNEVLDKIFKEHDLKYTVKYKTVVVQRQLKAIAGNISPNQNKMRIKGTVTDVGGRQISGAGIAEKGTLNKTVTDANGKFMLIVDEDATVVISHIGYNNQEIKIKNNEEPLSISLIESLNKLDEIAIINTGYQRIKKDQLTGAASTLNESQYQQRVAVTGNFLENLEGKVPGLIYNPQNGQLSIRGVSTFDAVKQPLIVLDGFPTEIDLRTINPRDIISVSVLRDAAAAAIYGARASNGVIIIETRRGKSGKPVFTLNSTYAIQNKPDFSYLNYMPANEFVQLQADHFYIAKPNTKLYLPGGYKMNPAQEILFMGPRPGVSNPQLSQEQVNEKLAALGSYDNLKEYENLFYQTMQAKNIDFDVSGGNEINTYKLGLNYVGKHHVNRGAQDNRFNLNLANNIKFSDRINFDFVGNYFNNVEKSSKAVPYANFFPYEHLADASGAALPVALAPARHFQYKTVYKTLNDSLMKKGLYDMLYYPLKELSANNNSLKTSSVRFQGRLNFKMTNWLNIDLGGNYENQTQLVEELQNQDAFDVRMLLNATAIKDPLTGNANFLNMPKGDVLKRTTAKATNYTIRTQLNLNHTFLIDHNLSGIIGAEQKKTISNSYLSSYFGYDSQTLLNNPVNLIKLNSILSPEFSEVIIDRPFNSTDYFKEDYNDRRFMSYYGQGTYIYKAKYIATGSFRIDQSNLFGTDPKYRNKPLWSAGFNWRIGRENFVKQLTWINDLQLRAATGFNGNVPVSINGSYLILQTELNNGIMPSLISNTVINPANQSIRWETTKNYNLGLDYSLLNDRIAGSVEVYLKRAVDVLGRQESDPTLGFGDYYANTASIDNKGLEFMISSANVIKNNFEWRTNITASFNKNKVTHVKEQAVSGTGDLVDGTVVKKGYPIDALFSYNYGGLDQFGKPYVLDKNGNKRVLGLSTDVSAEDLIYNGTTTPKYVIGLNNQFTVGAFDFSFLFMYYGGHVMRVEPPNPNSYLLSSSSNPIKGSSRFWRKPGDELLTNIPGFSSSNNLDPGYFRLSSALYGYLYGSQFVRKADFIRLRDVVITYRTKSRFLNRLGLKNTALRLQAQNVFRYTFSGNDIDPDAIDRKKGTRFLETQPLYSLTFSTNF